jgi:hypothetical protein
MLEAHLTELCSEFTPSHPISLKSVVTLPPAYANISKMVSSCKLSTDSFHISCIWDLKFSRTWLPRILGCDVLGDRHVCFSTTHECYTPRTSHSPWFDHVNVHRCRLQFMELLDLEFPRRWLRRVRYSGMFLRIVREKFTDILEKSVPIFGVDEWAKETDRNRAPVNAISSIYLFLPHSSFTVYNSWEICFLYMSTDLNKVWIETADISEKKKQE